MVEDELTGFELAGASHGHPGRRRLDLDLGDQGLVVLNGAATVTISNVAAGNGIAHVVNAVLAPGG